MSATPYSFYSYLYFQQENIDVFKLTSKLSASITALPFDQDVSTIPNPTVNNLVDLEVTRIKKEANVVTAIPPWIPIVSAVGALVIIAGMVGGFHKVTNYHFKEVIKNSRYISHYLSTDGIFQEKPSPSNEGRSSNYSR